MYDFICQTSNKTYPHVSTVKLDDSISCGTPDLDAHAEKIGNPVVLFQDVATDCGQQMALYVVNYLLLLLLKHRLHHHGVSIKKTRKFLEDWLTESKWLVNDPNDCMKCSLCLKQLKLCLANRRAGYFSSLACDWLSTDWAYSEKETEMGPDSIIVLLWCFMSVF